MPLSDKKIIPQTPVMKQFLEIKSKHKDALVLFRMGDFYETFLEDAETTSKILGIVLTKRANGKASDVALAGFPYHSLDNYLPKLVRAGHRVAICEQVEDPNLAKGIVKREVVEVVTPGTLISDQAMSKKSNRYIGSINIQKKNIGLAFLDLSTGEFHVGECFLEEMNSYFIKFSPNEIILSTKNTYSLSDWYLKFNPFVTQIEDWVFNYQNAYRLLSEHFKVQSLKGYGCDKMKFGISAGGALLYHISQNLSSPIDHVTKIKPIMKQGRMGLDEFTIRNLEIFQSLSTKGDQGTLINCIDQTQTAGGGRLLRQWLHSPLLNKDEIEDRLNLVESFTKNKDVLMTIRKKLSKMIDMERIMGKVNHGKSSPRDILGIASALYEIPVILDALKKTKDVFLINYGSLFLDTSKIAKNILETINEDSSNNFKMGNIVRKGVSLELDELRSNLHYSKGWMENYQKSLREELSIPKLKIAYNKVFGYYIEVTKVHQDKIPDYFIRKQTLVNSERYITEDIKNYEEKILGAEEKILLIETKIFSILCDQLLDSIGPILDNAKLINKMDLLCAFAYQANIFKYVRPSLHSEPLISIKRGRHPVVEKLLPSTEKFIPNDLDIHSDKNQIHIITGPNMAGKSTYLRQIGLIALMAQIGSFVPAESAKVGIIDRLFTRVGASDNLSAGESTFLVEMSEAASILNNASDRSLILLDEIGRGTATFDGLSIAWSIIEYLHETDGLNARTLFATHYHELSSLENLLARVENHYVTVKEFDDEIVFLRSIAKGTGNKSYGIHVARMAGLPTVVIQRALDILNHHIDNSSTKIKGLPPTDMSTVLKSEKAQNKIRKALNQLDVNNMTPIEALQTLNALKNDFNI